MEQKQNKRLFWGACIYLAIFLLILLVTHLTEFNHWLDALLFIFRPVLIGLILAYLANPLFRLFETKPFYKIHPIGLRRGLSLFFTFLSLSMIVVVLLMLIVPQLIDSIQNFAANADGMLTSAFEDLNGLIAKLNATLPPKENGEPLLPILNAESVKKALNEFLKSFHLDSASLLNFLNANTIGTVIGVAGNVLLLVTDIIIGIFISLYLLGTKEKRYAQVMRFRRAFFSDRVNAAITKICTTADHSFGGFLKGKIIDSSIIGVLVYLSISLMGVPYAILIAVLVAITDIVPIIGPFIGVIPSAIIILLTEPAKVIPFLICILVIQQIDGNIIAPKILGENTGVSSLCVMIAITTMGTLWGLVGMIIGVPLFATVLELTGEWLDKRLMQKGLSTNTDAYYAPETAGKPLDTGDAPEAPLRKQKKNAAPQAVRGGTGDLTQEERRLLLAYEKAFENRTLNNDPELASDAEENKNDNTHDA